MNTIETLDLMLEQNVLPREVLNVAYKFKDDLQKKSNLSKEETEEIFKLSRFCSKLSKSIPKVDRRRPSRRG